MEDINRRIGDVELFCQTDTSVRLGKLREEYYEAKFILGRFEQGRLEDTPKNRGDIENAHRRVVEIPNEYAKIMVDSGRLGLDQSNTMREGAASNIIGIHTRETAHFITAVIGEILRRQGSPSENV